jgi:hypothetical protein
MDPITGSIITALAAGVAGGATEVGKKLMVDAYDALKAAIEEKRGEEDEVVEAMEALEQKPASEARQAVVAEEVAEAELAEDEELVGLAQALLEALEETPQGQEALSKYNVQITNSEVGVIGDDAHIEGGIKFGK